MCEGVFVCLRVCLYVLDVFESMFVCVACVWKSDVNVCRCVCVCWMYV